MRTERVRITGGERGYRAAVRDALYGSGTGMHNSIVRWSHARGFVVKPGITSRDEDQFDIWPAAFSADTGRAYGFPTYADVRNDIEDYAQRRYELKIEMREIEANRVQS